MKKDTFTKAEVETMLSKLLSQESVEDVKLVIDELADDYNLVVTHENDEIDEEDIYNQIVPIDVSILLKDDDFDENDYENRISSDNNWDIDEEF